MGSSSKTVTGMGYSKMFGEEHANLDLMMRKVTTEFGSTKSIDPLFIGASLLQIRKNFNPHILGRLDISSIGQGTSTELTDDTILAQVKSIDPTATVIDSYDVKGNVCGVERVEAFMYEEFGASTGACNGRPGWNDGGTTITYGAYTCEDIDTGGDIITTVQATDCAGTFHRELTYPKTSSNTISVDYDGGKFMRIFEDDSFDTTATHETYLAIDYKLSGQLDVEKYLRVANSIMGMANGTLDETLSDDKIEDFFMGYGVEYGINPDYDAKIDELMGAGGYIVEWEGNVMKYGTTELTDGGAKIRTMEFNGAMMKEAGEQKIQYMIPLEWLFARTMRENYDDLKAMATFFVFTSEEVDVEWYQSGYFQILMLVIAIVMAAYGMPQMLIGIISKPFIQALFGDSVIGEIIMLVYAVYSMDAGTFASVSMNSFNAVLTIASQAQGIYYKQKGLDMQASIQAVVDETKALDDASEQIANETMYIPMDVQDLAYNAMYEDVYKMYNQAFTYDAYFNLKAVQPYKSTKV